MYRIIPGKKKCLQFDWECRVANEPCTENNSNTRRTFAVCYCYGALITLYSVQSVNQYVVVNNPSCEVGGTTMYPFLHPLVSNVSMLSHNFTQLCILFSFLFSPVHVHVDVFQGIHP